jgi:DNA (cytosine-5)-methyltransferase 1
MSEKLRNASLSVVTIQTNKRNNMKRKATSKRNTLDVVSMFAGCGGLDLGFTGGFVYKDTAYSKHRFKIIKAFDIDPKAVETYRKNIGPEIEQADLSCIVPSDIPYAQLLIGGFPCQEFSSCGPQGGLSTERGRLYRALVNYMDHHCPFVIVAENVINLERMQSGDVLRTIMSDLESAGPGYRFQVWRLFAPDYGVPQFRHRLFMVGVRNDLPGQPVAPTARFAESYRSIDWAIEDLEDISDESIPNQSQFFLASRARKGNGQGDETNRLGEPSYCIRANPKSRVQFHYKLDRRLTVRECARLQTFPDNFAFYHSTTANISQIGNAVPPILGHAVAKSVSNYLSSTVVEEHLLKVNSSKQKQLLLR